MGLFRRGRSENPELARCSVCGKEHPVATMVTRHRDPEDLPPDASNDFPHPRDWHLEDAAAMSAEHPRSFFIPPETRRRALRPAELVRLGFAYGPHADREGEGHVERMWVEVLDQRADGHAHGRLRNSPIRFTELAIGDRVAFEAPNVLGIDYSDEELGYAQDQWPVVDRAILDDDIPPDVVVRGPSALTPDGSDWWLLRRAPAAGLTAEDVGSLTDRFPGLEEPFRAGDGIWEITGGEGASARWTRADAGEERWQRLRAWLDETAAAMRAGGSH